MSGRARYAAILRTPHVAPLLLASMLARLPYGVYALARDPVPRPRRATPTRWRGSSTARSASARRSASPLQSRLIDRFGQRRVLLPAAVLDATATAR